MSSWFHAPPSAPKYAELAVHAMCVNLTLLVLVTLALLFGILLHFTRKHGLLDRPLWYLVAFVCIGVFCADSVPLFIQMWEDVREVVHSAPPVA